MNEEEIRYLHFNNGYRAGLEISIDKAHLITNKIKRFKNESPDPKWDLMLLGFEAAQEELLRRQELEQAKKQSRNCGKSKGRTR